MNKAISTALLLAAGTALSQAASVVFSFGSNASALEGATQITTTGVYSITQPLTDFGENASLSITHDKANTCKFWNLAVSGENWSNTEGLAALEAATGVDPTDIRSGLAAGDGGNVLTFSFSGLEANTDYVISTILSPQGSTSTFTLTAGEFVSGNYGRLSLSSWGKITDGTCSLVGGNLANGVSMVVTSNAQGTISFTASQKSAVSLLGIANVPEPSTFGLLAGLGALALVAARRRRGRKA